mmetsp:Transcript_570/g.1372  ORF Transcript_570/g.1372 Transcript_570/m.1372 type:complete len:425 (-) Transcript_570:62-1336(-)|eukprot:CAMPEP_0195064276 /NCGR_PEP_ID=MMETSP0448-20130528/10395_1 /TAXON_ID=66468 /ORGANISM="Heterocapsa triquestra, Strain CCMP 448" /LENGTH=424 /DNA_ID=CAMNT_0040095277 /DNA_START=44 /DNA_END=1318 /DNA_ORIENTATION=-
MTEVVPTAEKKRSVSPCAHVLYYLVLFFAHWFGAARFDVDGDGDFDPEDVEAYLNNKHFLSKNFAKKKKSSSSVRSTSSVEAGGDWSTDQNGDGTVDAMDMMESKVEGGGPAVEDTMFQTQRPPLFIITECLVAFGFWAYFAFTNASQSNGNFVLMKAGLDNIEEGKFDLRVHDDSCGDFRWQAWRWWSYQFTHVGAMHILMNCFLSVMLGVPLEGLHGTVKLAFMFNVGVFGGACCFLVNDAHTVVVGMSGGCYALIGIHFANVVVNWGQLKFRKPILVFLVLLVATDLVSYFLALGAEDASHSAHMGGAIAGAIMGVLIGTNVQVTMNERIFRFAIFVLGIGLVAFCMVWNAVTWPPNSIWGGTSYCWVRQVWQYPMQGFVCVRCAEQECIDQWTTWAGDHIGPVNFNTCVDKGWYNEQGGR